MGAVIRFHLLEVLASLVEDFLFSRSGTCCGGGFVTLQHYDCCKLDMLQTVLQEDDIDSILYLSPAFVVSPTYFNTAYEEETFHFVRSEKALSLMLSFAQPSIFTIHTCFMCWAVEGRVEFLRILYQTYPVSRLMLSTGICELRRSTRDDYDLPVAGLTGPHTGYWRFLNKDYVFSMTHDQLSANRAECLELLRGFRDALDLAPL